MRTVMEYMGRPQPIMQCNFKAEVHPPAPPFAGPEYDAWKKKLAESPEMLITFEIVFPRYYWRARYIQQGNQPLYIVDCPVKGNAVLLKECAFLNNVDLRLPNGTVIRGFPYDDMPADLIRKNTAVLEQEGFLSKGDADIKAAIVKAQEEMRRDLAEGVGQIAKAAQDATLPPGKRKWWENLLAAFKTCPASMKEGEKWEAVARKVLTGVWENTGNASWTSVYLGKTTFRNLSEEYRKKKTAFPLWKDKLWTLLDRQWTAAQEKAWGEKLRRYAERERDKVQEKTAEPKKPA